MRGGEHEARDGRRAKRKGVVRSKKERSARCSPKTYNNGGKKKARTCLLPWPSGERRNRSAPLAEIEQAVDEQINRLCARMIEQAAQASDAAEHDASQELVCEQCGQPLQARGRAKRRWQTHGGQEVEVERTYVSCLKSGGGFFPPGSGITGT
jgi:hypothetical protein